MVFHEKDSGDVRTEALAKGAEQAVVADCPQYADVYFALAKTLGATDEDVRDALRAAEARNKNSVIQPPSIPEDACCGGNHGQRWLDVARRTAVSGGVAIRVEELRMGSRVSLSTAG